MVRRIFFSLYSFLWRWDKSKAYFKNKTAWCIDAKESKYLSSYLLKNLIDITWKELLHLERQSGWNFFCQNSYEHVSIQNCNVDLFECSGGFRKGEKINFLPLNGKWFEKIFCHHILGVWVKNNKKKFSFKNVQIFTSKVVWLSFFLIEKASINLFKNINR